MQTEDILALAKAGFNAQQIAALNKTQLNAQYGMQQAPSQPVKPAETDYVKDMIDKVFASAQAFNVANLQQPPTETAEDILATILNPKDVTAGQTGGVQNG